MHDLRTKCTILIAIFIHIHLSTDKRFSNNYVMMMNQNTNEYKSTIGKKYNQRRKHTRRKIRREKYENETKMNGVKDDTPAWIEETENAARTRSHRSSSGRVREKSEIFSSGQVVKDEKFSRFFKWSSGGNDKNLVNFSSIKWCVKCYPTKILTILQRVDIGKPLNINPYLIRYRN